MPNRKKLFARISSFFSFQMSDLPVWLVFLFCFYLLGYTQLSYISPSWPLNHLDEGIVAAFARRMIEGDMLPYVDAVSHRGPVYYWFTALVIWLFGFGSWLPIRICSLVSVLVSSIFFFLAGKKANQDFPAAVAIIVFSFITLVLMNFWDGSAHNSEFVLNLFASLSFFFTVSALSPKQKEPSVRLLFAAGSCLMLAMMSKQVALVLVFSMGPWILSAIFSRPDIPRRKRIGAIGGYLAGLLVPLVLVVIRYTVAGELGTFYYYFVTYNSDVYMEPYTYRKIYIEISRWVLIHLWELSIVLCMIAWGIMLPLFKAKSIRGIWRAIDEDGFVFTVALSTLATLIAAKAPVRNFDHYYITMLPWAGLLVGIVMERLVQKQMGPQKYMVMRSILLALMCIGLSLGWSAQTQARPTKAARTQTHQNKGKVAPITRCGFIEKNSKPTDSLFVWGFAPQYYTECNRSPASRYVFTTFVAGYVPWVPATPEQDEKRAVPGSRDQLIADLEVSKPPIIIDSPLEGRRMAHYRKLADYLQKHYCDVGKRSGQFTYLRKQEDGSCPEQK